MLHGSSHMWTLDNMFICAYDINDRGEWEKNQASGREGEDRTE